MPASWTSSAAAAANGDIDTPKGTAGGGVGGGGGGFDVTSFGNGDALGERLTQRALVGADVQNKVRTSL